MSATAAMKVAATITLTPGECRNYAKGKRLVRARRAGLGSVAEAQAVSREMVSIARANARDPR
jgi:hypothetical protein